MTAVAPRPVIDREVPPPAEEGDRFVGVALLGLTAVFVGIQLLATHVIPILAIPGVIYLVLGVAILRRVSRRLLWATAVLVGLHITSGIPFIAQALAHPESPGSFLSDAFVVIVALTVIAGAVTGLRGSNPRARRVIVAVAAAAGVLAIGVSMIAAAGVESAARQSGDVAVEVAGGTFSDVEIPAGSTVLWVDNTDVFRHTLVVEGTDVHVELPGTTAVRAELDLAPGTYRYFCDVPGHESMVAELRVR